MDGIINAIANLFGGNASLATFIMSMIPLVELKGGIVFAIGKEIAPWQAFLLAFAGSTVVFFVIFFLLKPVLALLKKWKAFNGLAVGVENYFTKKAEQTLQERENGNKKRSLSARAMKMLGVFIFVAIPLPMTGVWTGTAIAVFLGLKFHEAIAPVVCGNLVAGGIILGLACIFKLINIKILDYVLWALFGIAIIMLVIFIIKVIKNKKKNQPTDADKKE